MENPNTNLIHFWLGYKSHLSSFMVRIDATNVFYFPPEIVSARLYCFVFDKCIVDRSRLDCSVSNGEIKVKFIIWLQQLKNKTISKSYLKSWHLDRLKVSDLGTFAIVSKFEVRSHVICVVSRSNYVLVRKAHDNILKRLFFVLIISFTLHGL